MAARRRRPLTIAPPANAREVFPQRTSGVVLKGTRVELPDDRDDSARAKNEAPTLPPPPRLERQDEPGAELWVDSFEERKHKVRREGATRDAVVADLRRDPRREK